MRITKYTKELWWHMNAKDNNENESVTPSILLKNLYSSVESVLEINYWINWINHI